MGRWSICIIQQTVQMELEVPEKNEIERERESGRYKVSQFLLAHPLDGTFSVVNM